MPGSTCLRLCCWGISSERLLCTSVYLRDLINPIDMRDAAFTRRLIYARYTQLYGTRVHEPTNYDAGQAIAISILYCSEIHALRKNAHAQSS